MTTELEEGDIVLCTVDRIVGTNVFVKIEQDGEGSIMFSEIAPGRIRNIRDYVVPKKKIVCKILRITQKNIELSFRRVTQEERKKKLEEFKQEKSYISILKSIVGEKSGIILEKISKKQKIYDFFEEAKKDSGKLEEFFTKKESEKILEILKQQKSKKAVISREIELTSKNSDGLTLIKNILSNLGGIKPKYIAAGHYRLEIESEDLKKADKEMKEILEKIEKTAKSSAAEFIIKEK